ncbi:MAG: hypothetical protein QOF48_160 [Verrucomicrobiota bacterium]|jgi:YD repeat-containing protein
MTTRFAIQTITLPAKRPFGRGFIAIAALASLFGARSLPATNGPVQLQISLSGSIGHQTPELSWTAQPGAFYMVQCRTNLASGSSWIAVEPVSSSSNVARWKAPELNSSSERTRFYQLVAPTPDIFSIEPSVVSTAGGVLNIVGQCLSAGGTVRVAGISIPPSVIQAGSVYSFNLPRLPAGLYDVEWIEAGKVVALRDKVLSVTTPPGSVSQRLFEPPSEPPASPMKVRKGGTVTGNININNGSALRMEGKKGLNAVNVKLARTAGIGDDCDDGNDDVGPDLMACLMKAKEKANRTKCGNNLRMIPATGEFQLEAVDMVLPGRGLDLVWARTYRSRTGRMTPMGRNWDHSYNIYIEQDGAAVAVNDGTGRHDLYFPGTNGIYTCDEFFNEGAIVNGAFVLTFADGGQWEFRAMDGSASSGKISRIIDRNRNTITLYHTIGGQLLTILDTLGRTNSIGYTADGFVASFTDYSGRVVSYGHTSAAASGGAGGVLTAVTNPPVIGTPNGNDFPNGKVTRYTYSSQFGDDQLNGNLTGITDPKGQAWLQIVYRTTQVTTDIAFDTVDYIQRGAYRTKLRRFPQTPTPQNGFAVVKCIVNDGVGNVRESFHDSQNRCVRQLDYAGRAGIDLPTTETQNRPVNKLRAGDPDLFETRMEWNIDSLCTRVIRPRGDSTEMVYQRAYNQNNARSNHAKRHDADVRVIREVACCSGADVDGDGVLDITQRAWRFEYDPRFGTGQRIKVKFPTMGGDDHDTFNRGPRQTTSLDGTYDPKTSPKKVFVNQFDVDLCDDFATSSTDPRGATEFCTYDTKGNRLTHMGRLLENGQRPLESYEYNNYGQVTAWVHAADGEGRRRRDECVYYDSGPQNSYLRDHIADCVAAGFHLTNTFEYDPRGNVVRHINPRGYDCLATYNALDQMMTRQTPQQSFGSLVRYATTWTYDANDNVVQVDQENRDESGVLDPANPAWTSSAEYDSLDRRTLIAHELTHVVQQGGGNQIRALTNRFTFDANDNCVLQQLAEAVSGADPNNVIAFQYDERDLLYRSVAAPGTGLAALDQLDYDPNGQCARISKIDSFTIKQTVLVRDGFNRCVQAIDAMGNVDAFSYDANDNLTFERVSGETNDVAGSVNNRRLSESRHEYDALNRPVRSRMAFFDVFTGLPIGDGESTRSCAYAPNGLLLSSTDDNGRTTRFGYDSADRLSSITDPRTNMVVLARDRAGNITSKTAIDLSDLPLPEQTFVVTRVYDGLNRCVSSTDNVGNTVIRGYDSRDNCVSERDPLGNETVRTFDGKYRITTARHYSGARQGGITINTTHVEYRNQRCVSATDADGNTTGYTYDSLDRQVSVARADGTSLSLVWSPRSNLARITDANGTVTDSTYDLLDRCVRKDITVAAGSDVVPTTTFEEFGYDGLSRLVRGTNNHSMIEFSYDSLGNRAKSKADCLAAVATFDGEGNRMALAYPGGRVAQFTYDALNRVVTVGSSAPGIAFLTHATRAYEGPDRLARVILGNSINTRVFWNGSQNPANAAGDFGFQQVSSINHAKAGGNPIIDRRGFGYDRNQNKVLRAQLNAFTQGATTSTNAWTYDALHRLTRGVRTRGASVEADDNYIIDPMGNRTNVMHFGVVDVYFMNPFTPEPADFEMNQYTLTPIGQQQYDRNGNLTQRDNGAGPTVYQYDYADRLISVRRSVGPTLVPVVTFAYDVLGRRISKTIYPPSPAAPITTQFIHDPDSAGDCIIEARQGGGVVATYVQPQVNDEVLVAFTAAGNAVYFHGDDLGNVLALTDERGTVLERYEYDDFGAASFLDDKGAPILSGGQPVTASPLGNSFLFHGMYWDPETGLYRAASKLTKADSGRATGGSYMDPRIGQYFTRNTCGAGACDGQGPRTAFDNNPWSPSGRGLKSAHLIVSGCPGGSPCAMKNGTVKFFNESKGFACMTGGGGDTVEVIFNPKEYTLRKVTVRGWNPEKKEEIVGESSGGRCDGHNNRTTDVTGEIDLPSGREMSHAANNPLYEACGSSSNPLSRARPITYRPGRPVFGN